MNMKDNIASRWRTEWDGRTDLARLGREFKKVVQFLDHVPSKRAALAAEGKLSRKGLDEAVRDHFASAVVPDLRRAAWAAEGTINVIAARRAKLLRVEFDKADVAGALLRRELRDRLCRMNEGQRVAAFMESRPFREAACEGPPMLSGFSEETRTDLKRRVAMQEHPEEAALLAESEEAVRVANAAVRMVADALQSAAGFEGNDRGFEDWMTASSAAVDREIEAEKRRVETSTTAAANSSDVDHAAEVRRDIDRMFREAFPTIFKSAA